MAITRRDFLKLTTFLAASTLMRPFEISAPGKLSTDPNARNILIIVFDALSATNINFYGYPRETMPNLTRLLDRATVYHNHYASANFTTPGTASILTGRYSWDHLALKLSDEVREELVNENIFAFFDDYYKLAYTHNQFADYFLYQFGDSITLHELYQALALNYELVSSTPWLDQLFNKDIDTSVLLKSRLADTSLDGYLYSLIFPSLLGMDEYQPPPEIAELFPLGVPRPDGRGPFILEDAIDWTMLQSTTMPQPFFGYCHFLPPHRPYNTRIEFIDAFADDGFMPPDKPLHPVVIPHRIITQEDEVKYRQKYDQYILYVDAEFNRLFTHMEEQGVLENTLVVFTSDHGELFERRMKEHNEPYLFEPVVKVPLIIFKPGQTEREDIHTLTSCIDLLPTLLDYTGHEVPDNLPGQILPGFSNIPADASRTIYAMDARQNLGHDHIETATIMLRRGKYKIIRYSGYADIYRFYGKTDLLDAMQIKDDVYYEVFDLENDPEEMENLASAPNSEVQQMLEDIKSLYNSEIKYPKQNII